MRGRLLLNDRRKQGRASFAAAILIAGSILVFFLMGSSAGPKRVVVLGDENRDGLYTGVDVELALKRCRPGCILRVGAYRYDDVAVVTG